MDYPTRIAIVTGSAAGLGFAFASTLLEKGSKVLLTDINLAGLEEAYNMLKCLYAGRVKYANFSCDVTVPGKIKEMFDVCEQQLGKPNLLINNAGKAGDGTLRENIQLLLEAPANGTEFAIEYMGKHNGGTGGNVVNIASIAGVEPVLPHFPYYSTAKAGLIGFTRTIGHPLNYGHTGVKVQCLCPSGVQTAMAQKSSNIHFCEPYTEYSKKIFSKPQLKPREVADALIGMLDEGGPGAVLCIVKGRDPAYLQ